MKRPRLVILDAYATNPGDLSWAPLEALADCTIYDRTPPAEALARVGDAEAVLLNKGVLSAETILQAPNLKYVGIMATGCNTIDLPAAKQRGLVVCNVPGYSTPSVAQHTFALLLELSNHVGRHAANVRAGGWTRNPDYCYWLTPQTKGIIHAARLAQMKPSAFLINTSRGPLVVESDLAAALAEGEIAGAAVDVLSTEPPPADNPLLQAPNCLITPHLAWATAAARKRLIDIVAENLRAYLNGHPINQIPLE